MSMKVLRKNWSITVFGLGIVVISFLICLTVYVLIRYGFEAQQQNIVILVASINLVFSMVLLVVTINSLRLVKRDVETRIRPFVSFGEIEGESNTQTIETNSTQIELHIPIQNTGTVPAENLQVITSTLAADSGRCISCLESQAPKLAPNNHYILDVELDIPKQSCTVRDDNAGDMKTILALEVKYDGIDESYEWGQRYRMKLGKKTVGGAVYNELKFIPIE